MVDPTSYVGTPFEYGGRGPDKFDCYGLVMQIHADKGIKLPDYKSPTDQRMIAAVFGSQLPLWAPTERGPGAVVLMRIAGMGSHCGYMLDEHRMLHTWESTGGVIIQRVDDWDRRILGFYRYVG